MYVKSKKSRLIVFTQHQSGTMYGLKTQKINSAQNAKIKNHI